VRVAEKRRQEKELRRRVKEKRRQKEKAKRQMKAKKEWQKRNGRGKKRQTTPFVRKWIDRQRSCRCSERIG